MMRERVLRVQLLVVSRGLELLWLELHIRLVVMSVFGGGGGDSQRPGAQHVSLHFLQRLLLVFLAGEAHKAVASRQARHRVRHDLCGPARLVSALEGLQQLWLGGLGREVAHEDGELHGSAVSVVLSELEESVCARDGLAVEFEGCGGELRASKVDEPIVDAICEFITYQFHVDVGVGPHDLGPHVFDGRFVHPRLQVAHVDG